MLDEAKFTKWLASAREICRDNPDHLGILQAVEQLVQTDAASWDGIISKLVAISGRSRVQISACLRVLRNNRG